MRCLLVISPFTLRIRKERPPPLRGQALLPRCFVNKNLNHKKGPRHRLGPFSFSWRLAPAKPIFTQLLQSAVLPLHAGPEFPGSLRRRGELLQSKRESFRQLFGCLRLPRNLDLGCLDC